jgi:hypothetical protein
MDVVRDVVNYASGDGAITAPDKCVHRFLRYI